MTGTAKRGHDIKSQVAEEGSVRLRRERLRRARLLLPEFGLRLRALLLMLWGLGFRAR